ncbi:MAG: hypothetical protein P9M06_07130 [Candidatus Saelkia tenebricola]|nr:hypothetical protein [Candidatus Saelkia tenebricola]
MFFQISFHEAIREDSLAIFRRIKAVEFSLFAAPEIERAIEEVGGWPEGKWVTPVVEI